MCTISRNKPYRVRAHRDTTRQAGSKVLQLGDETELENCMTQYYYRELSFIICIDKVGLRRLRKRQKAIVFYHILNSCY